MKLIHNNIHYVTLLVDTDLFLIVHQYFVNSFCKLLAVAISKVILKKKTLIVTNFLTPSRVCDYYFSEYDFLIACITFKFVQIFVHVSDRRVSPSNSASWSLTSFLLQLTNAALFSNYLAWNKKCFSYLELQQSIKCK